MAKVRRPLERTVPWTGPNRREHWLDHLVKRHQWRVGVEVGVRTGRTLFHLLDSNPDLRMYAVDKDVTQFYNSKTQLQYGARLQVLPGISWEVSGEIPEPIDFVFVDAGHSTKSVTKDIRAYRPLLRHDQGLTGHDIDFPAVQQALADLNISYDVGPDNTWIAK